MTKSSARHKCGGAWRDVSRSIPGATASRSCDFIHAASCRASALWGYQHRRVKNAGSSERPHDGPERNEYSYPHDALQDIATRVFGDAVRAWYDSVKGSNSLPLEKRVPQ